MKLVPATTQRFVLVGVVAAALQFALTFGFLDLGMSPLPATMLAYGIGFVFAYCTHKQWTFRSPASHQRTLPLYAVSQVVSALIGGFAGELCEQRFGTSGATVSAISTLSASVSSYFLSSRCAFRGPRAKVVCP